MKVIVLAILICLLNLPFGLWRAKTQKFSLAWFLSIHLPIPFVVVLRLASGIGYHLNTFPPLLLAYFLGQFIGGRIGKRALST